MKLHSKKELVSIVMPSYNQARYIQDSIQSVLSQSYDRVELIIADGGSTDGTVEIIKDLQGSFHNIRWISEKDNGPAHAINKALSMVRGTTIGWLNSDDLYSKGAIERAMNAFAANQSLVMVYGQGQHIDESSNIIDFYPTQLPSVSIKEFANGCFICQPTVFFKRTVPLLIGTLDQKLQTAFDFDYWFRIFKIFPDKIGFVDEIQAFSRLHSECITNKMRKTVAIEGMRLISKYLGSAPSHWIITYLNEFVQNHPNEQNNLHLEITSIMNETIDYLDKNELVLLDNQIRKMGKMGSDPI